MFATLLLVAKSRLELVSVEVEEYRPIFVLGEVVFFRATVLLLYLVFIASAIQVFVLAVEEPGLRRRYGALYSDYCNATNRWLPRRPRPAS